METSIKDRLKDSQGTGNAAPKLDLVMRIEIKDNKNVPAFVRWDKETKENVVVPPPIEGILIGQAMEASSYSDNLGKNGGNYKSSYYFKNDDTIALFAPTAKGYEVVCKGTMPVIEKYINENSTGNLKKKQVLFVLTEIGLIAISTNLSIAIDQITQNKEALQERYIVLTPKLFDESDKSISKRAKEYLGKFRKKNPPKHASISVGEPITLENFEGWETDKFIEAYKEWKQYKSTHVDAPVEPKEEKEAKPSKGKVDAEAEGWNPNVDDDSLPF